MYVPSNSPKYTCRDCRNKIPVEDLEAVFHEQLKSFFFSPEEIGKYLEEADKTIQGKQELLQTLERERGKVRQEMEKTHRLYLDDQISSEGFGAAYRPMEERLKQLEEEIPDLQGEVDFLKIQYLSSDEILSEARDLYGHWPELSQEEKGKVVENITERIIIGKDDLTINLCYLPSSEIVASGERNLSSSSSSWREGAQVLRK